MSNVIQRDNVILARKLHPALEEGARENDKSAKDEKLWSLTARREVVSKVLEDWVKECEDEATVEVLLTALNYPDFKDVKLRIETLIHLCY